MRCLHLTIMTTIFLALAMCFALSSCQKKDAPTPATDTPKTDAAAPTANAAASVPKKGDEITFGSYPQTVSNNEALTWIVLDVDDTKHAMLLLSKYIIDVQPYHTGDDFIHGESHITWENCSLRAWLNHEFLNHAFTTSEQNRILTTHLTNPDNEIQGKDDVYDAEGGNDTDDKVFLLSLADVWHEDASVPNSGKYFTSKADKSNEERKAFATLYAIRQGVKIEDVTGEKTCANIENVQCAANWWLRSPGRHKYFFSLVLVNGYVGTLGDYLKKTENGVRPAMWVQW